MTPYTSAAKISGPYPPCATFVMFAAKNAASTRKKAPAGATAAMTLHPQQQRRRHQHRRRDRDPISRGEIVGFAEADRQS